MEINYIGEHLWPGRIGNLFVVLSFVAAILGAIAYFIATNKDDKSWRKMGRSMFFIHGASVFGIVGMLMYMLVNHMFEYQYVWQHSNTDMPMRYILSCFWEGQEGSFLLWTFWHVILAFFVIWKGGKWEAPVMATFSLVQAFLASMLLGIYLGDHMIGSNPFRLLREHVDYANLPFIQNANYLAGFDGRGLNPLLQNYWMTIHPPTLFLGFALTAVPFCYAIAGLWTKRYNEWLKPALSWTFIGIGVLGIGILMGGAWAYEALSFGGFWAWDPVENASLVPWLTLVGAGHVMVIHKNKGQSLVMTFILTMISFLLVLYSTFLVRSGILGDTSVHAFTDLGMSGQLVVYLLAFVVLAIVLMAINWTSLPKTKKEDELWSREFWMFIGALVLSLSAFQITVTTSIPVYNTLFGQEVAPPTDVIDHYNSWQLPFAILVALFVGFTQFLRYKNTDGKVLLKDILPSMGIALVITAVLVVSFKYTNVFYVMMAFATLFAITGNLYYWITKLKGKTKIAGASVSHIGFGMILLGAFVSTSNTQTISLNTSGIDVEQLGEDFNNRDNILLFKDDTVRMGEYNVSYQGRKREGINLLYRVDYMLANDPKDEPEFSLYPVVQTNPRMGDVAEPDTKHYLGKDIYTHVTYAETKEREDEWISTDTVSVGIGDTLFASTAIVILDTFNLQPDTTNPVLKKGDIAAGANLIAVDQLGNEYEANPLFIIRGNRTMSDPAEIQELGLKFVFRNITPATGKATIELLENRNNKREFIVMKALVFPGINILWAGCILMAIGITMAVRRRLKS